MLCSEAAQAVVVAKQTPRAWDLPALELGATGHLAPVPAEGRPHRRAARRARADARAGDMRGLMVDGPERVHVEGGGDGVGARPREGARVWRARGALGGAGAAAFATAGVALVAGAVGVGIVPVGRALSQALALGQEGAIADRGAPDAVLAGRTAAFEAGRVAAHARPADDVGVRASRARADAAPCGDVE